MAKLPTYEEMGKKIAEEALDGYIYKGKTLREWIDILAQTRWIPVSEGLPEEHTCDDGFIEPSEYVLVQMKSGYMKVSRYWGSRERYKDRPWIDLSYPTTDEVIAWMPLPERYKEGE